MPKDNEETVIWKSFKVLPGKKNRKTLPGDKNNPELTIATHKIVVVVVVVSLG